MTKSGGCNPRGTSWSGPGRQPLDWSAPTLACRTSFASNEEFDPDCRMVPEGNESLIVKADPPARLRSGDADEAIRGYRMERSG